MGCGVVRLGLVAWWGGIHLFFVWLFLCWRGIYIVFILEEPHASHGERMEREVQVQEATRESAHVTFSFQHVDKVSLCGLR
jgi:hypothetical protein